MIGKYIFNFRDLEKVGTEVRDTAAKEANMVIIDEIGPMKMKSKLFQDAVTRTLAGPKSSKRICIDARIHPVIYTIKTSRDAVIPEVTLQNRNILHSEIVERFV